MINVNSGFSRGIFVVAATLLLSVNSMAQLSGPKTIPADYASIADFVTDLNTQGVGPGGVTFTIPAGYTETAPASGFVITATGTVANPVIIQGAGMPKPVITANAALPAGGLNNGIFVLQGADYITIDGLALQENAANLTTALATNNMTEWGIAVLYASTTDGSQNVTLQNNTIVLNRNYFNTFGIYSNATHTLAAPTTSATATSPAGSNSGLKVYGNAISNVNIGIVVVGPTGIANYNNGIDIGGSSAMTGNTITDFGTNNGMSGYANVNVTSVYGVLVRNAINFNISNNTITSSNGGTVAGALRAIFVPTFTSAPTGTFTNNVNNNAINVMSGNSSGQVDGITVQSSSASATSTLTVDNNDINAVGHTVAGASGSVNFIVVASPAFSASVSDNDFNALTNNTTGSVVFLSCAMNTPAGGTQTISNNELIGGYSKTGAGGTVTVYTTNASSVGGSMHVSSGNNFSGISVIGATNIMGWNNIDGTTPSTISKNIFNNTFSNWTAVTGTITGMGQNFGDNGSNVHDNTISNFTTQGAIIGINLGGSNIGATQSCVDNTITNLASTGTGANVTGIANAASAVTTTNISGNDISLLSSTGASAVVAGITSSATNTVNITQNVVFDLSAAGVTPTLVGISTGTGSAGTINIFKNKIYNLNASGVVTNTAVIGLLMQGAATANAYNNVIGALTAPVANSVTAINGIRVSSTVNPNNNRVYNNTVYLNATSSGTNFGTYGLFHTNSATPLQGALDLRNNIIINESTSAGTGLTVAYRRSATGNGNYNGFSNRNLFYAGTPSAANLLLADGTVAEQTLAGLQAAVTPRETASLGGEAFTYGTPGSFFISLTPSNADYLKPVAGISTFVESGASLITTPAITDDYASVIRGGNVGYTGTGMNPDMGAFEFEGVDLKPVTTLNSVSPAATTQCTTTSRLVSVNITTSTGTITGATLNYSFNGVAQTPIVMVNTSGTIWEGTIPASTPVNATVTWNIVATSSVPQTSTYTGATYADEPTLGYAATASSIPGTICNGETSTLKLVLSNSSPSAAPAYIAPPAVTNPTTDEDLGGVVIHQGADTLLKNITPMNSLVGTIGTATGTTGSYSNFTSFPATVLHAGMTYNFALSSLQAGTAYNNSMAIFIDYNRNGVFTDAGEAVYIAGALTSGAHTETGSFVVPMGINPGLARMRVGCKETSLISSPTETYSYGEYEEYTVNLIPAPSAITWSDGVGTVGMGSPLDVTPSVSTPYTGTATLNGCPVVDIVDVDVNPLPSDPAMTPSTQCGSQIPDAFASSTSGLPTPEFNWYDAPAGGSLLQSGPSDVYTTVVTTTTTFHVSELNPATGCESARVPVTVTVIIPDAVTAAVAMTPVCEGETITLLASNDNPVPVQNYTYFWSGPAGSGAEAGFTGASVTITPTIPGNYSYLLTAVDGICTALDNISADVNPLPVGVTADASVSVTCDGAAFDLFSGPTGSPVSLYSENFDAGIGGWTTVNAVSSPAQSNWAVNATPYTYDGATDFTNFSTAQGGGFVISNSDDGGSGSYTDSELISPVFSTDGMISASISFEHIYYKFSSGDDVVRIEISTDGMAWAVLKDYMVLGSQGVTTSNAQVTLAETVALPAMYLDQPTVQVKFVYNSGWGFYWLMDDFDVIGTPEPLTYDWTSSPAGFTSSLEDPTGVTATVTTDYMVKVTNSFGCEASATTTVTAAVSTVSSMNVTNCIDYTLNAQTYTMSGVYTQNLVNAAGCDSTLTLNLTITTPTDTTITAAQCAEYVLNATTYTTSGTYMQIIPNVAGCDSTITLDLTITPALSTSLNVNACNSYTHDGNTFTTSGMYDIIYTGVNGCDSIVTIDLTIDGPATATNIGNAILVASTGLSYQWVRCPSMDVIPGATFQTYEAPANGDYAVIVDNGGGCVDTSDCVTVSNVGLDEEGTGVIRIYPNPTNGEVNIQVTQATAVVEVLDAQGKLVEVVMIENTGIVDLTEFTRGVYYLRIKTDDGITMHKVIRS